MWSTDNMLSIKATKPSLYVTSLILLPPLLTVCFGFGFYLHIETYVCTCILMFIFMNMYVFIYDNIYDNIYIHTYICITALHKRRISYLHIHRVVIPSNNKTKQTSRSIHAGQIYINVSIYIYNKNILI